MFATAMDSLEVEQIQEFMEESIKGLFTWQSNLPFAKKIELLASLCLRQL